MSYKKKKSKILNILTIPLAIYLALLIARIVLAANQAALYPNEYREAANVAIVRALLNGQNPYSLSSLSGAYPSVCYLYGILMSLVAAGISLLLPSLEIQTILYGISFVSIIISAMLVSAVVKRLTNHNFYPFLAFVLTIFCHWRYGCYLYGAPDSFGLMIMIAVLFCLAMSEMKDSDAYTSWAAIFTVATLFTKQYYLMIAATGFIFYLITSRKRLLKYVISGAVTTLIAAGIIALLCPLYWTYTLYFIKGPGAGAGMGKSSQAYNNMQVTYLGGMLLMLFVAVLLFTLYIVFCFVKKKQIKNIRVIMLFYIQAALSFLVLRYIGNNNGAFITYYLQLFTPALILISVTALSKLDAEGFLNKINAFKIDNEIFDSIRLSVVLLATVIFVGYTLYKVEPRLVIFNLSNKEIASWNYAYEILDEHSDGEIYYVPPLAYHGYRNGLYVYNDGQPFVFTEKYYEAYQKSELAKKLFPHAGEIIKQHLDYRDRVREKVKNGEYSLLCYLEDMDEVFTISDMQQAGYKKYKTVNLRTGNWAYDIELWTKE